MANHLPVRAGITRGGVAQIQLDELLYMHRRGSHAAPNLAIPVAPGETTSEVPGTVDPANPSDPPAEDDTIPTGEPGSILEIRRLDEVMDLLTGSLTVKPTPVSTDQTSSSKRSKYDVYIFTVVRRFTPIGQFSKRDKAKSFKVTRTLDIQSSELRSVGAQVIGQVKGVSWAAKPLRVNPQIFLAWLPELEDHLETLSAAEDSPTPTRHEHLLFLTKWLKTEYSQTLETLDSLVSNGEITFDLLWAIYVPSRTIIYTRCPTTSEPHAVRLIHAEKCLKPELVASAADHLDISGLSNHLAAGNDGDNSKFVYRLHVQYLEVDIGPNGARYGYANLGSMLDIPGFSGAQKITSLGAYPLQYYAGPGGPEGLKTRLVERARKWANLAGGVHHLAYKGVAFLWQAVGGQWVVTKHSVDSRIMIDRQTFAENMPNYEKMAFVSRTLKGRDVDSVKDLNDEVLMLAPPAVHGFSLADKEWLEFAVELVQPFTWNTEAYQNLVIPPDHKAVLTTLVEAHGSIPAAKVNDFVKGKGLGLVINLYGNPGTGKSLTAEAMSEHLKKPLYVVGAADLGTAAPHVDQALSKILKISATWGAVVLIDEADVFLEERALHHIERNAMVAVFLRHLEYFRGILFLTTNRVRVFDEAFQSRIHVSLRYQDLTSESRRTIWVAFLRKVHGPDAVDGGLTHEELRELGEKRINGRQIKNVVKTASALAAGRQETLVYKHLVQVLDMMNQFDASHSMYN